MTNRTKRLIPSGLRGCAPGGGLVGAAPLDIRYQDIEGDGPADRVPSAGTVALPPPKIANRSAALDHVRSLPPGLEGSLLALFLDPDFTLLAIDRLGEGNVAECGIRPSALVGRAAMLGAAGFILIHHAPKRVSGVSTEEYRITADIRRSGEEFEIHLLDHVILAGDRLIDISL